MPFRQDTNFMVNLAQETSYRGLASSRVSGKDQVHDMGVTFMPFCWRIRLTLTRLMIRRHLPSPWRVQLNS